MARVTQTQGGPRWNPYTSGEMRKLLKDELDKLSSNDTYRNSKVGTPSFKDAKGRTNWNIYLLGELFERFTKRFDDTIRGTYTNTIAVLNTQQTAVNNISAQLKSLELNVNKYLKSSFDNVLTNIVKNGSEFDQFRKDFLKTSEELSQLGESNKSDIRKATKILKDNIIQEINNLKSDVAGEQQTIKEKLSDISTELKSGLEESNTRSSELVTSLSTTMSETSESIGGKLNEMRTSLVSEMETKLNAITDLSELIGERMEKQRDAFGNMLEDRGKMTVSEIVEKLNTHSTSSKENLAGQAEKLAHRIEDVNDHLEVKINESSEMMNTQFQEFKEKYEEGLKREMGDLRQTLNAIRADMEIMKTLLASIAK